MVCEFECLYFINLWLKTGSWARIWAWRILKKNQGKLRLRPKIRVGCIFLNLLTHFFSFLQGQRFHLMFQHFCQNKEENFFILGGLTGPRFSCFKIHSSLTQKMGNFAICYGLIKEAGRLLKTTKNLRSVLQWIHSFDQMSEEKCLECCETFKSTSQLYNIKSCCSFDQSPQGLNLNL